MMSVILDVDIVTEVDTSIQQCSVDTITINSIGGYRRAKCTCFDQNGETVQRRQKWFFPNGDVVKNVKQYDSPYSVHRKYVSTLIIPWSTNSSYYGIYTCGIEKGVYSIVNTVEVRFIENIEPGIYLYTDMRIHYYATQISTYISAEDCE